MIHVLIRHRVADYSRWKQVFDAHLATRKRAGESGCQMFLNVDDPHDIYLLTDWTTVEEARKFMNSDDLRQRMQEAGVQGSPEIQYLQDAHAVHRSAAD